jgi:hypothetical protein
LAKTNSETDVSKKESVEKRAAKSADSGVQEFFANLES